LAAAEEQALKDTTAQIDGAQPAPATGTNAAQGWGTEFKNHPLSGNSQGALPKRPLGFYREYRVIVNGNTSNYRIVTGSNGKEMWYSWTHYGETGSPSFVKIR